MKKGILGIECELLGIIVMYGRNLNMIKSHLNRKRRILRRFSIFKSVSSE